MGTRFLSPGEWQDSPGCSHSSQGLSLLCIICTGLKSSLVSVRWLSCSKASLQETAPGSDLHLLLLAHFPSAPEIVITAPLPVQ